MSVFPVLKYSTYKIVCKDFEFLSLQPLQCSLFASFSKLSCKIYTSVSNRTAYRWRKMNPYILWNVCLQIIDTRLMISRVRWIWAKISDFSHWMDGLVWIDAHNCKKLLNWWKDFHRYSIWTHFILLKDFRWERES